MPDVLSAGELVSAPAPSDCQLSRYHRVARKLASVCGPITRHTASKVKSPKPKSKTNTQTRIAVEDRRIKAQEEFSEEALKIKKPRRVAKTLHSKRLPRSPRNPAIATQMLNDPAAERTALLAENFYRHRLAIYGFVGIEERNSSFVVRAQRLDVRVPTFGARDADDRSAGARQHFEHVHLFPDHAGAYLITRTQQHASLSLQR